MVSTSHEPPDTAQTPALRDEAPALSPTVELQVVAAARVHLGTAGLHGADVDGDGVGDRWPVETAVVAVANVAPGYAVATVHGLVIEHDGEVWRGPRLRAVAVPLSLRPQVAVAGAAWPLPLPPAAIAVPATSEPDPPAEPDTVIAALTDRGWRPDDVRAVEAVHPQLLRVELSGTAPDAEVPARHVLWIARTPTGLQLVPTIPQTTTPTGVRPHEESP